LNDSDLFSVSSLSSHSLSDLADYDDLVVDQNKLFGQAVYPTATNEYSPMSTKPGTFLTFSILLKKDRTFSVSPMSSTDRSTTLTPDRDLLVDPLNPRLAAVSNNTLNAMTKKQGNDYRIEKPPIRAEGPAFQNVTAYDNVEPYPRQTYSTFQVTRSYVCC
jgi:hypothetical protein